MVLDSLRIYWRVYALLSFGVYMMREAIGLFP